MTEGVSLQKRAQELKKERDTVKGQMDMARDELKKTQDLLNLLSDSQTVALPPPAPPPVFQRADAAQLRCKTTMACLMGTGERMPQPAPPRR